MSLAPDYYQHVREHTASLHQAVGMFLSDPSLDRGQTSHLVNRAIRNDGAVMLMDRRRSRSTIEAWRASGGERAEAMIEDLEATAGARWDAGIEDMASALTTARESRKVLMDPETARLVVSLDEDGTLSRATGVDVPSYYGMTNGYDPVAGATMAQVRAIPANTQVDFSRPVVTRAEPGSTEPVPLAREAQRLRDAQAGVPAPSAGPTPIRQALMEELAALRARQGFTTEAPGQGPELG